MPLGTETETNGIGCLPDEELFEQLYRQWRPEAVALCRKLLGRMGDAEDAAQEAFLRAWAARDRFSPVRPFWPWLATIARRLCVDERRRLSRELERRTDADGASVEVPSESVIELADELRIVFRTLDGLRPAARRAFVRREIDGWSYQQIATIEGVTVDAVRSSLKRARASVRKSRVAEGWLGVEQASPSRRSRPMAR